VSPFLILLIGIVTVIGMIIILRVNAFIALIAAAILVSLLAPGDLAAKVSRVAEAFGGVVGAIGIVIAMAAVIGRCLMDSGAADRIVRAFLRLLGQKRAAWALMGSGFILSVPVFFDTVFYLLVPLARSLYRRTQKNYILYVTAIVAGAGIAHTLVPPTPGPLFMAEQFGIDIGLMILMGIAVGLPTSVVGLLVCRVLDRFSPIPMRSYAGEPEAEPLEDKDLPPLSLSLLPVLLPVVLISANTIAKAVAGAPTQAAEAGQAAVAVATAQQVADVTAVLGNPNLALLLSAAIAMALVVWKRGLTLRALAGKVDKALMSGGIIILITAAGGAFGAMLRAAGVQTAVKDMLDTVGPNAGLMILLLGFGMSVLIKFAQGSGTVAMITTASMFAAMGISSEMLGCHPVYLAMAIGSGSLVGDWMNNSGFWIFARMSVLTETETLRTWTILTAALGVAGFVFTLVLAAFLPLV
jgi:GntP family gluconate:H+ symporter